MEIIATNEWMIFPNNKGSSEVNMWYKSIPLGFNTAIHLSIISENIGMSKSSFPISFHCEPIPENTNQIGRLVLPLS